MKTVCNHPDGKCDSMCLNVEEKCIHNCAYKFQGAVTNQNTNNEIKVGTPIRTYKAKITSYKIENTLDLDYDDINDNTIIICGSNLKFTNFWN